MQVRRVAMPRASKVASSALYASYCDSYAVESAHTELTPLDLYVRVMRHAPAWADVAMRVRNKVGSLLGLRNLGAFSQLPAGSGPYAIGQRVGIFELSYADDNEVILTDSDHHLSVQVSIMRDKRAESGNIVWTISTVVHLRRWYGRVYLWIVLPAHYLLARYFTAQLCHHANASAAAGVSATTFP